MDKKAANHEISVKAFVEDSKRPGSLVQNICTLMPEVKKDLEKQLETFADDFTRLSEGKLSYAEMRRRYG